MPCSRRQQVLPDLAGERRNMLLPDGWIWELDGWIVATGMLCAVAASLLGNFLVLRRLSMLGDAITHAVLPGLAVAFFISDSRSSWPMFAGAVIVGVLTAFFTEWVRGIGKVDEGASMGVVFTSLFALGLVLIVQAADHVDLDPGCVLYGAIELTPLDTIRIFQIAVPKAVVTLGIVAIVNALFVTVFFKELKLCAFDPALATTTGYSAALMHYLLMILVAITAVASFESVGNILVVAMFIVPPATACLLTDRLPLMIGLSTLIAAFSAVTGHVAAISVPKWFGYQSTTTAGMMAVMAGVFLSVAVMFSPRQGVFVKLIRRRWLTGQILADDVVALLYRIEERGLKTRADRSTLRQILLADASSLRAVLLWLQWQGQVGKAGHLYQLTDRGRTHARSLVRSHRLWEQYLLSHAGVDTGRLHQKAEQFEHFTDRSLRDQLDAATSGPETDPHGQPIPPERSKPF